MMRQIVLDTETTGLSPEEGHRIIEVGCLELVDRQLTHQNFHQYFKPDRPCSPEAVKVHGITDVFLADKPAFEAHAEALLAYLKGAELIIHNAPFDVGFLNAEFERAGMGKNLVEKHCTVLDTLPLARQKHPGQRNHLDALCKRYNVSLQERDYHGALLDARLLSSVYLLMTGGQTQLFAGAQDTVAGALTDEEPVRIERTEPFVVPKPTLEEQAAHTAFLNLLQDNGASLWDESD